MKTKMEIRVENLETQIAQLQQQQSEFVQSIIEVMTRQFEDLKRELKIGTQLENVPQPEQMDTREQKEMPQLEQIGIQKKKEIPQLELERESSASKAKAFKEANNSTDLASVNMDVVSQLPPSSIKVCIICSHDANAFDPINEGNVCHVYVVDAGADADAEGKKMKLILKVKVSEKVAVQVLNSTLYMFTGLPVASSKKNYRSAYKYKLDLNSCKVLREMDLDKLPKMAKAKTMPLAAAAPDGKRIIVFSAYSEERLDHRMFDFEVFDTESEKWRKKLPPLKSFTTIYIEGYGFFNDSIFVVTFSRLSASLYIDIDDESENNCWKETQVIEGTYGPFVVIEDEQLFISIFDIGDLKNSLYYPLQFPSFSKNAKDLYKAPNFFSLICHEKKKNCIFWNLATAQDNQFGRHYLAVNMYTYDIKEFLAKKEYLEKENQEQGKGKGKGKGEEVEEEEEHSFADVNPSPTLIKSLEYELTANPSNSPLVVIFAGPIPEGSYAA